MYVCIYIYICVFKYMAPLNGIGVSLKGFGAPLGLIEGTRPMLDSSTCLV